MYFLEQVLLYYCGLSLMEHTLPICSNVSRHACTSKCILPYIIDFNRGRRNHTRKIGANSANIKLRDSCTVWEHTASLVHC